MGMVVLILLSTLVLSMVLASISNKRIKYLYPVIVSLIFIPSVFIHYNETALIHSIWYLVDSAIGILLGTIIYKLSKRK